MKRILFFSGWFVMVFSASACQTPVFRYALEQWPAAPYRLELAATPSILPELAACANLETVPATRASARLLMPAAAGDEDPQILWEGEPTPETLTVWIDSPARRKIADRICAGDSAVFVVLERGGVRAMLNSRRTLEAVLEKAEKKVLLSKPASEGKISEKIPLLLRFSSLIISEKDVRETGFVSLLKAAADRLPSPFCDTVSSASPGDPLIFVVMGRGMLVGVFNGASLPEHGVMELCKYMAGACSCEAKESNPGADLLFCVDWEGRVEPAKLEQTFPLPSLSDLFGETNLIKGEQK